MESTVMLIYDLWFLNRLYLPGTILEQSGHFLMILG